MEKFSYAVGDYVVISKRLSGSGVWETTDSQIAKVVEVRDTVSLGAAHTLEINGEKLRVCYWTSDIDGLMKDKIYSDPDWLWKTWGDK